MADEEAADIMLAMVAVPAWHAQFDFGTRALAAAATLGAGGQHHGDHLACPDHAAGGTCRLVHWVSQQQVLTAPANNVSWLFETRARSAAGVPRQGVLPSRWLQLHQGDAPGTCTLTVGAWDRPSPLPGDWLTYLHAICPGFAPQLRDTCAPLCNWLAPATDGSRPPADRYRIEGCTLVFPNEDAEAVVRALLPRLAHSVACLGCTGRQAIKQLHDGGFADADVGRGSAGCYPPTLPSADHKLWYGANRGNYLVVAALEPLQVVVRTPDVANGGHRDVFLQSGSIRARKCELLASEERRRRVPADLPDMVGPYIVDVCDACYTHNRDSLERVVRAARTRREADLMVDGAGSDGGSSDGAEGDEDEDGPVRPKVVTAQNTQSFIDLMRPLFAQANARCRDAERELTESQVCACVRAHCAGLEAHLTASCRASELSTLAHL